MNWPPYRVRLAAIRVASPEGATVGVMSGGAQRRAAKQQAAEQGQQAEANAAAQSQAISAQQKATFNKGFSACMEGKGYTAK